MKRVLLIVTVLINIFYLQAQVKNINLTLNPSHTSQVYFQFGSDNKVSVPVSEWDLAFLRINNHAFATRVNDAKINVYEVANMVSAWNDVDISNQSGWKELYNSEIKWESGAFDKGSATYGWGEYNMPTHHVLGTIVFVLKYDDGMYRKFMIQDYFKGYTCKFSTWDGTIWSEDQTFTILNTTGIGKSFNYYSLTNNKLVETIPLDEEWDLFFTKYYSNYNNSTMYKVTGAFHNSKIRVAKKVEGDDSEVQDADFKTDINTVGDSWKKISDYDYIIPDNKYYIKLQDNTIYKIWFTEYGGASTGDINFSYENVTGNLEIEQLNKQSSFSIYPNPVVNKTATLLYEVKDSGSKEASVSIYATNGQKMYEEKIIGKSGFYTKEMNLSKLTEGIYFLVFQVGEDKATKKIIIK